MSAALPIAGIELGGTKSIALLAKDDTILERVVFPTSTPGETLGKLRAQLAAWQEDQGFGAIGIASFGPLQLDHSAPGFGSMLRTPKVGWSGAAVASALIQGFDCPWNIDTDVNGAALAEYRWGAGAGCDSLCYITIGTGLGGGILIGGRAVHGAMHPELGHLRVRRIAGDEFVGVCPFHGDCIEGLVAGPALAARFGSDPALVPDGDPRWQPVAADLAELIAAILLTVAPQRILVGGGVSVARPFLLPLVRERTADMLGGYLPFFGTIAAEAVIRAPMLGADAGPLGAIALGLAALDCSTHQS